MPVKFKSIKSKLLLLINALVPRLLFIVHGLLCTDLIVWQEKEHNYWCLSICVGLIVIEGIFNVLVRDGKEFHWICPSALLYCIVLIVQLTVLRLSQMHCIKDPNSYKCRDIVATDDFATKRIFASMDFQHRISFIEQTGMGALIIGRWSLPKGSISKEQVLQIILIYIGTAADILELSEIYDEDIGSKPHDVIAGIYYGTISLWALSISQFAITIALPEEGLKKEEDVEPDDGGYPETSYFRSKFPNKVTPMSYMHYKNMLREGTHHELNKPLSNQRSRGSNSPREVNIPRYKNNPQILKMISQNALSLRNSNNSSPLPSINTQGTSHPRGIIPSEGNTQPTEMFSSGNSTLDNNGSPASVYSLDVPKSPKVKPLGSTENVLAKKPDSSDGSRSLGSTSQRSFSKNRSSSGTRNVWRRVLNQYTFSKKKKMNKKRHDSETEDNSMGVGKKEIKSCFVKYVDLIEMLQPVCIQDGPFFILRVVLLIHFDVTTDMTYLLIGKNLLVVLVQVYRILLLFCSEPKNQHVDIDDQSNRVRTAMDTNRRLSMKNTQKTRQEYLSMYVLNAIQPVSRTSRMKDYGMNYSDLSC